jgi:AcrR family transcriptional regulator
VTASTLPSLVTALVKSGEPADGVSEKILDAALEEFRRSGVRGASLDAIAKRAGIGRVTIYRRFDDKNGLVRALTLREVGLIIAEVDAAAARGKDVGDRFARGFVAMLHSTRTRPFFRSWLKREPDDVLRNLTLGGEMMMRLGIAFIAQQIRDAQRAGELPPYDPQPTAEILARFAHSLMLTPRGGISFEEEQESYRFACAYIVPLIMHGPAGTAESAAGTAAPATPAAPAKPRRRTAR